MVTEMLVPSRNLIIASFGEQKEAEQVYETLQLLRQDGQRSLDAFLVSNSEHEGIQSKPLRDNPEHQSAGPLTMQGLSKLVEENEVIGNLVRTLSPSSSVLMVTVGNDESSAVMVTFLAIIMAGSASR